jgi:ribosomal protein S18 acetylase RimI-like enzyme
MQVSLPSGYELRQGSDRDLPLLVEYLRLSYRELSLDSQNFDHLQATVDSYFSQLTPLWLVETQPLSQQPIACLWLGNAIDQLNGERYAHIFLIFVDSQHRCRGIGKALLNLAENWARDRGDRQIGLQVFISNRSAWQLYQRAGFETSSILMTKSITQYINR